MRHSPQIALLGFLIMGVAYGPFTLLNFYFLSTDRVFYYSAVGAAVCVMTLLYFVTTQLLHSKVLFIIAGSVLIGITSAGAIVQHQHAADWSHEQQRLLTSMVKTVPQFDENATLIVYQDRDSDAINRIDGYNHPIFYT